MACTVCQSFFYGTLCVGIYVCAKLESIQLSRNYGIVLLKVGILTLLYVYLPCAVQFGIVSAQSKNQDKVRIIQYGDQLLNISFYLALLFNRSYYIFFLHIPKAFLCKVSTAIKL